MSIQKAKDTFLGGMNCAQSVLSAYGEKLGLNEKTAFRTASAFGAGMGRLQKTCGALTGAFMVIGLKHGKTSPDDQAAQEKTYSLVRSAAERFEKRFGSTACRDILDCDITTPEGLKKARDLKLFTGVCADCVEEASKIVEEIINWK